jgi:hypothetical protein
MTAAAADDAAPRDDLVTRVVIGLLAYAAADIAHHVLGHGAACLALGGRIVSLSSIFVNCTVRRSAIDLAGPFANLAVGLAALALAYRPSATSSARLFFALTAGFNLFWFALLLLFSAATRTDDFAWPMAAFHVSEPLRYGLIALGGLALRAVGSCRGGADGRLRVAAGACVANRRGGMADGGRVRLRDRSVRPPSGRRDPPSRRAAIPDPVDRPAVPAATCGADIDGRLARNRIFGLLVAAALIAAAASMVFLGPGFSV